MEASALTRVSGRGLLARRSPLLRFEADERLVDLIRAGHDGAFEALFTRYNSRLLGFCQSMLKSRQDAEDVLQEVFTNAHTAMLADERKINVRPWLYRIARNRCLNHLRKQVPEGQDSMDVLPAANGITTAEHVQNREDLRQLMADVETLPETQRTALLLREIDQLSYDEIALAMQTTVPSVKSLLVRARIGLAESGQARLLTCEEVQVTLAEAAEGIGKASGPARKHVRDCKACKAFRDQLRSDRKAMAALFPIGLIAFFKHGVLAKIFGGGSAAGTAAGGSGAGAGAAGAVGGASAASGITGVGMLGGAIGAKAVAGFATAAILTAGAVEARNIGGGENENPTPKAATIAAATTSVPHKPTARLAAMTTPAPARTGHSSDAKPATNHAADQRPANPNSDSAPVKPDETEAPKPGAEEPVTVDPATGDGDVAVGAPIDPGTGGDGGQDTGAAPENPTTPSTPTPTTPTTPSFPPPPATPPTYPSPPDGTQTPTPPPAADSTVPPAPPTG
jgi:RNA polymerase sigma factor (sigma-70 family)